MRPRALRLASLRRPPQDRRVLSKVPKGIVGSAPEHGIAVRLIVARLPDCSGAIDVAESKAKVARDEPTDRPGATVCTFVTLDEEADARRAPMFELAAEFFIQPIRRSLETVCVELVAVIACEAELARDLTGLLATRYCAVGSRSPSPGASVSLPTVGAHVAVRLGAGDTGGIGRCRGSVCLLARGTGRGTGVSQSVPSRCRRAAMNTQSSNEYELGSTRFQRALL